MNKTKIISAFLALALLLGMSGAWAHGARVGVYFGPPVVFGPAWYPAPYYYPPAPVIVTQPAPPPVYIEQSPAPAAPVAAPAAEPAYWYYCKHSKAYYPYVKECAAGWERVLPQPEK